MRFELSADALRCRVCGAQVDVIGKKSGNFIRRDFFVTTCSGCGFSSVANPVEDLGALYSQDYYAGRGADPLVDYMYELDHPTTTIRICEWSGIRKNVESLLGDLSGVRWLD